jgi:hypothetical protein
MVLTVPTAAPGATLVAGSGVDGAEVDGPEVAADAAGSVGAEAEGVLTERDVEQAASTAAPPPIKNARRPSDGERSPDSTAPSCLTTLGQRSFHRPDS